MRTRPIIRAAALGLLVTVALSSCGGEDGNGKSATDDTPGEQIEVRQGDLGTFLVDDEGRTLYMFTQDSPGTSVCEGECLAAWPALSGDVTAGEGVDESLLGAVDRSDGSAQATYADWPLYYFAQDQAAGDVNGQGVNDVWYVLSPAGEVIKQAPDTGSDSGSGGGGGGY